MNRVNRKLSKLTKLLAISLLILLSNACSMQESTSAAPGTPLSQWTTDQLLSQSQQEFENKNYANSVEYLKEAAGRDDKKALYALGYMYYYGNGITKNAEMAQDLIRRSAALGHEPAIQALRIFVATKSTFSVNTEQPAYISQNNNDNLSSETRKIESNTSPAIQLKASKKNSQPEAKRENTQIVNSAKASVSKEKTISTDKLVDQSVNKSVQLINENNSTKPEAKVMEFSKKLKPKPLDNKWLKSQDPNNYTVQITTSRSLEEIQDFINKNNLKNTAEAFVYTYRNNIWYGVGFGVYDRPSKAYQAMLNDLPNNVKTQKPWVRQFKNIQPIEVE